MTLTQASADSHANAGKVTMKRSLERLVFAVPAILLSLASGVAWYAFSTPPIEHLPLPDELIAPPAEEGRRLLTASPSKVDHGQLDAFLRPQIRRGFCGPATMAAVINAALQPPVKVTQTSLFTPAASAIKSELAVSLAGLTLDELAQMLRAHGLVAQVIHSDQSDVDSFRTSVQATLSEPLTYVVVNYDRPVLGQSGAGHISPLGAFDPHTDRVLVLDVAAHRYPYTWVPVTRLWRAMNTIDTDSGRARGYLLITVDARAKSTTDGSAR
jgi:hypothetical protein